MKRTTDKTRRLDILAGGAAIYGALVYLVMMIIFLAVLDYPSITNPAEKVLMLVENQGLVTALHLAAYVVFGLALVILAAAIYEKIGFRDSLIMKIATIYALVWATLLIASGLIFNHGVRVVADMYVSDPNQAVFLWQGIEVVSSSLSFVDGELLGGLWMLILGHAALASAGFNKAFAFFTIGTGIIGILSLIPVLNLLSALFGIGQIIWFVWLGGIFLTKSTRSKTEM